MPYLTHPSGVRTFYYDNDFTDPWTPTTTILIHHGFGRNSNFWYKWIPILAKHYRVIRRDALGHGYSSAAPPGHPKSVTALMDEVIDTLDQLKIDKVHWLGESTGGIFGELLAVRNPERFLSLTICGTPLNYGPAGQAYLSFGYPGVIEAIHGLGLRLWGERCAQAIGTSRGASDGFMEWWLEQFSLATAQGVADYAEVICREEFDATPIMKQIRCPLLSLAPADSGLVDLSDQERLVQSVPGAALEIIPDSHEHEIYLGHAEICQEKFLEFLAKVEKS